MGLMLATCAIADAQGESMVRHASVPSEGDWIGTMISPVGPLQIAIHLRTSAKGPVATIDTVQFGERGGVLSHVSVTGGRLHFDDPAAQGQYDGRWDAAGDRWIGTWTAANGQTFPLNLSPGLPPPLPRIEGLDGDWEGGVDLGPPGVLRLTLHVQTGSRGTTATLDLPDAGRFDMPVRVARNGRDVSVNIAVMRARYQAELSDEGGYVQGEFSQGNSVMPLVLTRSSDEPSTSLSGGEFAAPAPKAGTFPSDAEIRMALARRIDEERRGVGIVVGLISPKGRRIVAYGVTEAGGKHPVDGKTLFEIGSITKTFTSLILQEMALRGQVSLDDPVSKYLPGKLSLPDRMGRPITLRELATHTSGLPRTLLVASEPSLAGRLAGADEPRLYAFLAHYQSPGRLAPAWSYSNLGVGILGLALSHRAWTDLPTLFRERVFGPLGMTSTVFGIPPAGPEVAVGHDDSLRPIPPFEVGTAEAAAGAIRSSANDMLSYLAAELGYRRTPLTAAMRAMLTKDYGPGSPGFDQELGWMSLKVGGRRIFTHSGATLGQRAFVAFDPNYRDGVVVLSNAESQVGGDDIGQWLIGLSALPALPPAPPAPKLLEAQAVVPLTPEQAKPYVGDYRLTQHITFTVSYDGKQLQLRETKAGKSTGASAAMVFHGQGAFTLPGRAGLRGRALAFEADAGSNARGFILRNRAGEFHATRVSGN